MEHNPLVAAWPDVLWTVVLAAVGCSLLVLWFVALNGVAKARGLSDTARAVWVLIVILAPVVGSLVWFAIGRPAATPIALKPGAPPLRSR